MSSRQPRWELVRTAAGWHARFRSSNGNVIVSSEVYKKRADAFRAVDLVLRPTYGWVEVESDAVVCLSSRDSWNKTNRPVAGFRVVDER